MRRSAAIAASFFFSASAMAALVPPTRSDGELDRVRTQVAQAEDKLVTRLRDGASTRAKERERARALRDLVALLQKERDLSQRRMGELKNVVEELEKRRSGLNERVASQRERVQSNLMELSRSAGQAPDRQDFPKGEELEAPRRRVMAALVDRSLKIIEAMKADLTDADDLQSRIDEERQRLQYAVQDLKEREEVIRFHRKLQEERKGDRVRLAAMGADHLENYRKLKDAEGHVDNLIGQFNARVEFERIEESRRRASSAVMRGDFARLKGHLPFPVSGQVVEGYGRAYDPDSGLHVFRKGLSIRTVSGSGVKAISAGQVVFTGVLPKYGNVLIIDHGAAFYSLCGRLGRAIKQKGDWVGPGDVIGLTDGGGQPLYFEIRSRNVPVDPLQWVAN
ncbi:MAG TPA: peptidoglycan DD-metalloendopeptidase family protein [Bdellovibrionota bacterium]|nr:peptidoglycan DD-metalloendopeptidase family protein [Bdellovibrionota bacterium]